ncbi:MAG: hypothetical protein E7285_07610 [Lachnospiraceae bacterium]|nr:hypothetical protein [Lachnospiraceae bacterium]
MEKKKDIFDFASTAALIYGFTITWLIIVCVLGGEMAVGYSSIFSLGRDGLSIATLLQFLLVSVLISLWKYLFFTDLIIKSATMVVRTFGMFSAVVLTISICVCVFGWFPVSEPLPWILFFVCFGISAAISTGLSSWKEKRENEKMEEALQKMKEKFAEKG